MKNNRGSLTIIAIFTVLLFSLYGVLLYARSASSYIRQSKSIETIQRAYAQDVPNAVQIAKQLGATEKYIGEYYTITFYNGDKITNQNIIPGNKVEKPIDPIGETGDFMGWYYTLESGSTSNPTYTDVLFDFDIIPTQNYTLFAKYKGEAMMCAQSDSVAFWQQDYRTNITSIIFKKDVISIPPTAIASWNIRANDNCSEVRAIIEDDGTGNGTYVLTIVSPYTIYGNILGYHYFNGFTKLESIDFSNFNTSRMKSMEGMFTLSTHLASLDLSTFDTSNVVRMGGMLRGCSGLTSLNLKGFHTENVTKMNEMFSGCSKLETVDLSSFNTSKVDNMIQMFMNCNELTGLDVTMFNTENVTNMGSMFLGCNHLTSIDISNFNTINVTNVSYMFYACTRLVSIDLGTFNTQKVTKVQNMFNSCTNLKRIYVKNNLNLSLVDNSDAMFNRCTKLVGGAGTTYDSDYIDMTYARIDGGKSNPGYFTLRTN